MGGRSAALLILKDDAEDRRIPLEAGSLELGRSDDNEICLPHISVSRRHARIFVTDDRVVFEDLGSGNGSWFKGKRIRTQTLVHGDEIMIEPFTLRLEVQELAPEEEAFDPTDGQHTDPQRSGPGHTEVLASDDLPDVPAVEPDGPRARLETVAGSRLEDSYDVDQEGLTLGRSEQRDVVLIDPAASRLHCEILFSAGRYQIRDPGSANGIYINGRRVRDKVLDDGDLLRIGGTEFRWVQESASAPSTVAIEEEPPEHTENFSGVMDSPVGPPAVGHAGPPPSTFGAPAGAEPAPFANTGGMAFGAAPEPGPPADDPGPPNGAPPSFGNPGFGAAAAPPVAAAPSGPPPAAQAPPPAAQAPPPSFGAPPSAGAPPPSFGNPPSGAAPAGAPSFGTPSVGGFGAADAPPDPLAPDLGDVPNTAGGFGGVEMAFGGGPGARRTQGGFFSSPINRISIGFLGLIVLMLGYKMVRDISFSSGGGQSAAGSGQVFAASTPENELLYKSKMEDGWASFREGRYFTASSKFAEAMAIIPSRPDAKRMAAYSFEFVVVGTLEEVVAGDAASAEEKGKIKEDALVQAQNALGGRSMRRLKAARGQVQDAMKVVGQDRELHQAETDLNKKIRSLGGAIAQQSRKNHASAVEELYKSCQGELQRRNYPQAKKCFKQVMADDAERKTPYYVQAEDGIKRVDNEMRKRAQPLYQQGVSFMNQGRSKEARSKFKEALRLYPDYTSAKQKLNQVQVLLQQQASEKYKQAKVFESANQIDKAIVYYKEVQSLVGNPKDRLHKMSQDRINNLVQ